MTTPRSFPACLGAAGPACTCAWAILASAALLAGLAGCVVQPAYPPPAPYPPPAYPPPAYPPPAYPPPQYVPPPPPPQYAPPAPPDAYVPPAPEPVVSVYVDPPQQQPEPIGVPWAPPPMLVEDPGPPPFYGAVWTGGYWVWDGQWVWAHGRWLPPPSPGYAWAPPYYEHRDAVVVFIPGFWRAPGVVFTPPPPTLTVVVVAGRPGIPPGPPCEGPNGVFVPSPPGSRPGIIVPAPVGTSPAVVAGSPPVIRPGMQIHPGDEGHVRIEAPPGAMANGQPLNALAPSAAHLAAAQPPVVRAAAPAPASSTPIRTFSTKEGFSALPPARAVSAVVAQPAQLQRAHLGEPARPAPGSPGMRSAEPQPAPRSFEAQPAPRSFEPPPAPRSFEPPQGARPPEPLQGERPPAQPQGPRPPQQLQPQRQGQRPAGNPPQHPGAGTAPPASKDAQPAKKSEKPEKERERRD